MHKLLFAKAPPRPRWRLSVQLKLIWAPEEWKASLLYSLFLIKTVRINVKKPLKRLRKWNLWKSVSGVWFDFSIKARQHDVTLQSGAKPREDEHLRREDVWSAAGSSAQTHFKKLQSPPPLPPNVGKKRRDETPEEPMKVQPRRPKSEETKSASFQTQNNKFFNGWVIFSAD